MASNDTTREQNSTNATTTTNATNATTHQDRKEAGSQVSQHDRERPIESGRESNRQSSSNSGMVRNRGNLTPYAGANSPFTAMRRMAEDMDRLFDEFGFGRMWPDRGVQALNSIWTPQVETFRRGDSLVIRADIPGVKKDDVHVEIENDMLTISGERCDEHEEDRDGFYRSERSYGQFYRAVPLPEGVNADKCDASFKDGVLEVTLAAPKQDERKAKRIQVK